jgi:hypothetical protein
MAAFLCELMPPGTTRLGVFDVIGISRPDFIAVQVKSNRWQNHGAARLMRPPWRYLGGG